MHSFPLSDGFSTPSTSEDERLARDMQLALDLQSVEDFAAREENMLSVTTPIVTSVATRRETYEVEHGFFNVRAQQQQDHMLFVRCQIDGRRINVLVDSGASVSAMTILMVQRLGLTHKFNSNVVGACGGVGSANIVGVIENLVCLMGHVEFRLYFVVIDSELPSIVLGLDQMRRFQCVIDLEKNCLVFGGNGGVKVPFLGVREARNAKDEYDQLMRQIRDRSDNVAEPSMRARRRSSSVSTGAGWLSSFFGGHR